IRKCKSKDSTKVAKKIVTHIKSIAARKARLEVESSSHVSQLPELDIQQVETPLIVESTQLATKSWNKRPSNKIPRTKHSSYFSRKTIAKVRYNYTRSQIFYFTCRSYESKKLIPVFLADSKSLKKSLLGRLDPKLYQFKVKWELYWLKRDNSLALTLTNANPI